MERRKRIRAKKRELAPGKRRSDLLWGCHILIYVFVFASLTVIHSNHRYVIKIIDLVFLCIFYDSFLSMIVFLAK